MAHIKTAMADSGGWDQKVQRLYIHKFDNLDETDQFLKSNNLPKLTQRKVANLNKPIYVKEIESTINNLTKEKVSNTQMISLVNSVKYLRKK